jgi:hypothetical protein
VVEEGQPPAPRKPWGPGTLSSKAWTRSGQAASLGGHHECGWLNRGCFLEGAGQREGIWRPPGTQRMASLFLLVHSLSPA